MPNWVKNQIKLCGDEAKIQSLLEAVKMDDFGLGTIDFNKIIPMPKELEIESSSKQSSGLKAYKDFIEIYTLCGTINSDRLLEVPPEAEAAFLAKRTDVKADEFALGKQAFQNIQKYGAPDWYEWCWEHWDTKWNACGYCPKTDYSQAEYLEFDTAWSPPVEVIRALSGMFPEIEIEHAYADEDIGGNCGRITYKSGAITEEESLDGDEAVEFAKSIWGITEEDLMMYQD